MIVYPRYVPVLGVECMDGEKKTPGDVEVIDLRDYNQADQPTLQGNIHLPYAYLKRHYGQIKKKKVVVVVADQLSLNLSVRFLRRKGFRVVGYYMVKKSPNKDLHCKINHSPCHF
ncbi:sulfurtransferase [Ammoniphilus sp. YIM 78166]|uniref:sulfurtransferase n=1 Tax=Ammoniphilus sp. YIM 78166 TaxID=1644106 RepID=UPI001431A935|nr:sulfurtransferase [Ammoniphilus sp. YIM 78166]